MVILEEKQSRRVVKPLNGILVKYRGCPARDEDDRLESARAILPDIFRQASLLRQQKQKNVRFLPETNSDDAGKLYGAVFKFSRSAAQKRKPDSVPVTVLQMKDFFCLLENNLIRQFLEYDSCKIYADSYLLAMVFTYFVRAGYRQNEYNVPNFFGALMLAHDVEEDNEELKLEFLAWALGDDWRHRSRELFQWRNRLFKRLDYRALVSRKCCLQVMEMFPDYWAWKRERPQHHGGALHCPDNSSERLATLVRGPGYPSLPCIECEMKRTKDESAVLETEGKRRLSISKRRRPSTSYPGTENMKKEESRSPVF